MALLTRLSHEMKFNALLKTNTQMSATEFEYSAFSQCFISYMDNTQNDIILTQKRNDVWPCFGAALSKPTKPKLVEHSQRKKVMRDACICGCHCY